MHKLNLLALILTTIALTACGKSATEQAVEAIALNPGPVVTPAPEAPGAAKWTGTGTMKMTGMPESACGSVNVEILEDANGFELKKFSYDCSGTTGDMDAIRLVNRSGELFLGSDKVGSKQGDTVDFTLRDSGATLGFRFQPEGANLKVSHSMRANGFEQQLNATLHK